jgi:ribosomal protein S20
MRVEAILDRVVRAGIIAQGEANQILKQWDDEHPDWQSPLERLTAHIMIMRNRERVVAVLDRAIEAGLISTKQADRILSAWDEAHPSPPSAPPSSRTRPT